MHCGPNHTLNPNHFPRRCSVWTLLSAIFLFTLAPIAWSAEPRDTSSDDVEIIEGEERTIYEYRQNGILTMIKIVPKKGRAYYMVPADGAPHYESLDHKKRLYPQWVILEW